MQEAIQSLALEMMATKRQTEAVSGHAVNVSLEMVSTDPKTIRIQAEPIRISPYGDPPQEIPF